MLVPLVEHHVPGFTALPRHTQTTIIQVWSKYSNCIPGKGYAHNVPTICLQENAWYFRDGGRDCMQNSAESYTGIIHWPRLPGDIRVTILSFLFSCDEEPSFVNLLKPFRVTSLMYTDFAQAISYDFPDPFERYALNLFAMRAKELEIKKTPCVRVIFRKRDFHIECSDGSYDDDLVNAISNYFVGTDKRTCFMLKTASDVGYKPSIILSNDLCLPPSTNEDYKLVTNKEDQLIIYWNNRPIGLENVFERIVELTNDFEDIYNPLTLFFVLKQEELEWNSIRQYD